MRTLGNLLWLILAGLWLAVGYATSGLLLCLTVIGIPFGVQAFKLAGFTLWPFGRKVVAAPGGSGCLSVVFNIFVARTLRLGALLRPPRERDPALRHHRRDPIRGSGVQTQRLGALALRAGNR